MIFHVFWLVFMVFQGNRFKVVMFLGSFHGLQGRFMVINGFSLVFVDFHGSLMVFKVAKWFLMVLVGFHGFQGSFMAFNVVSWLCVSVHGFSR